MDSIVIFGTGKIAEVIASHIRNEDMFRIAAFTVHGSHAQSDSFLDAPVVPFEEIPSRFPPNSHRMHVAVGYHQMNRLRASVMREAQEMGYVLSSVISRHSWPGATLECGDNCFVADGASIEPGARLGHGVYVWSNAVVGHHATIGDHAWIAAGSAIGGGARIGPRNFLALNATVGNEVETGAECLLGARTLTTRDLKDKAVVIERDSEPIRLTSDQFLRISKLR